MGSGIETMGSSGVRRVVQYRAKPGSDLLATLEDASREEAIGSGVIVSGVGALERAVFRNLKRFPKTYPVGDDDRLYLDVETPMELVSLGGWIAPGADGTPDIHAHFSASMVEGRSIVTMGGHLSPGTRCGIKVVVAILVLNPEGVIAREDPESRSQDIFWNAAAGPST
ncbi:MAG: DNA-binding protein [Desulfobacterales bacterium]|jgi:predicted DNA-binding protein with PD1-like motif